MQFSSISTIGLALAAGFLPGCAVEKVPAPILTEVCLADNVLTCINVAFAGSESEVTFLGEHFQPAFEVNLDNTDASAALGRFSARIGNTPFDSLVLGTDLIRDRQVLRGRLPGSVPLGTHDVEVQTPGGQRSLFEQAFHIADPFFVSLDLPEFHIPVGYTTHMQVSLENLGPALISDITLSVSQHGGGRCILPDPPVPFSLPGGEVLFQNLGLQADQAGTLVVSVAVLGLANETVAVGTSDPLAVELAVLTSASMDVEAYLVPEMVQPGRSFELIVHVSNQGQTPVFGAQLLDPLLDGSGAVEFTSNSPPALDLPPGASRIFRWEGTATSPGIITLQARVSGMEAISGRLLGPVLADVVTLQVL